MMNLLERLFGKTDQVPGNVPREWAENLEALLAPIDAKPAGGGTPIVADMLRYVLVGEPANVVATVVSRKDVGEHLQIIGWRQPGDRPEQKVLYAQFDEIPPAVGVRWARLLEAATGNQHYAFALKPGGALWPEALLYHAAGRSVGSYSNVAPRAPFLAAATMERLLEADGLPASAVLVAAFSAHAQAYRAELVGHMPGHDEAIHRHLDTLRPLIVAGGVTERVHALGMLKKAGSATLVALARELADLATCSSKQVRAAAEPLVRRVPDAIAPSIENLARAAKPDQRVAAMRLLWSLGETPALATLRERARELAAADKAPSARELIAEWTALAEAQAPSPVTDALLAVPDPVIDWTGHLTPGVAACVDRLVAGIRESVDKANRSAREHHAHMAKQGQHFPLRQQDQLAEEAADRLKAYIAAAEPQLARDRKLSREHGWHHGANLLVELATDPALTPVALVKMLAFCGLLGENDGGLEYPAVNAINAMHRTRGVPTLLEFAAIVAPIGLGPRTIFRSYCRSWNSGLARDWSDDAVWPFFAKHADVLVKLFRETSGNDYWFDRSGLFGAFGALPAPPGPVVHALFELALGPGKSDRQAAQTALAKVQGKEARIIAALEDGKGETRAVAAQWLGRLRAASAIPALEQAVRKEKLDVPKGAMLDALQALGRPVEAYLDRKALAADARKTLAKGVPKELAWFPWSALPAVHWADSGEPVSTEVMQALLVQAFKQKSPEPNAVLRKYCALWVPRERAALGQYVLESWLAEDVRPVPPADAEKKAMSFAKSIHASMQQHPQYYREDPLFGQPVEALYARYLPGMLREPAGSAIASKGLLAVAAACCAEGAAPPVARYLKEWYGTRAAHGKALIAMLAWVEHPSATQLMLSIGNRFRTKSFQEEATRQAELLAERRGWTLAELADRTMPSAGFDETGTLELSYGLRTFTARLLDDFKIELLNPDGKKIAALPEPRQDDDAERAKDAKKALSAAKKEVKTIVSLQTDRLYEALCTERDWAFADWNDYLNGHPIVRRLVQRLVWAEIEPAAEGVAPVVKRLFRPLDDGTLTDADDDAFELAPDARVRIAHDSILDEATVARWQQHLADYAVAPLFQQLGKGRYVLPAERSEAREIKDFEGHVLEAFALRGRATKLGYTRGSTEDGGWFYNYEKRFPTLGIEAVIEFTGNPLPEQNRTVALTRLAFLRSGGERYSATPIALARVPRVLLSECWNDMRLIAAEGTGFDPEWQKRCEL